LARSAIILHEGVRTSRELRLGRVLDFFGVPWETVELSKLADAQRRSPEHVVFGLPQAVSAALERGNEVASPSCRLAAIYTYASDDREASQRGLQALCGDTGLSLQEAPAHDVLVHVSRRLSDFTGPMAGLEFSSRLAKEDAVLVGGGCNDGSRMATVISASGAPVFVRLQSNGVPVFFCASPNMVDLEEPLGKGFYDVREHFCSVVPLVMFIRFMFREVAWRPQELGACLIIDDPLLRLRYGYCDFVRLRDLMRRHRFTTNIAFIPWNWRRTSPAAGDFFRNEAEHFSISIHGCDHVGSEFGTTSREILDNRVRLALSRMRNHEARTGIHHDPIMVFPQGVFSSVCPEVLKRNKFLAAVNTETVPVDAHRSQTRIKDVWDIAIRSYGGFPIFTRRYAFHGLENFAFDLLLGKPCLIVSHHDFFKDGGIGLIELIEKLGGLNCSLRWRPLGDVIRRACRRRVCDTGMEEVEMYGNELLIDNSSDQSIEVKIRKNENQADLITEILCDDKKVIWTTEADQIVFGEKICSRNERHFHVVYREHADAGAVGRTPRFELAVALRRVLSEFRDDYLSRSRFLATTAAGFKHVLTRVT
jgi:hypothetical protein